MDYLWHLIRILNECFLLRNRENQRKWFYVAFFEDIGTCTLVNTGEKISLLSFTQFILLTVAWKSGKQSTTQTLLLAVTVCVLSRRPLSYKLLQTDPYVSKQ